MWAANSRDYVLPRAVVVDGTARPLGMQVVRPDGTLGPRWGGPAGTVAYSPDRRRATVDPGGLTTGTPAETTVLDPEAGALVTTLPAGTSARWPRVAGWYDRHTVVRLLETPELQVVDVRTGAVVQTVPLRGMPALSDVQLGPATGRAPGF